jgi:hypothetical protein
MAHDFSANSASRNEDRSPAVAEVRSYPAFDQWMDAQLELLVARWIHTAAPNANRLDRAQQRFGRQPLTH